MNFPIENETTEYKKSTGELSDAIVDIVAILNKSGEGVLYFGIKNDGTVCGMDVSDKTLRNISQKIYEQIKPQIYPQIEVLEDKKKKIIKVTFSGVEKPYSAGGKYYIRVADESRELNPTELAQMILDVNYKDWERQITNDTVDDIDDDQLKEYYKKAIKSARLVDEPYDKTNLLFKLGLLAADKVHLNNAGKYLFSNKKPMQVKMAVFATDEKLTFIDIKNYEGNILGAINASEKYVKENIKWKAEMDGFSRKEYPEIPIEALREIIINSFAHASYISSSRHEIDIHPGKIAIYNPGSFPDGLTPIDFAKKDMASKIRNKIICDCLYKCQSIEAWGTGFKKTYKICEEKGMDIEYSKEQDGFWFIFKRKSNESLYNTETYEGEYSIDQFILDEMRLNPRVTIDELSRKINKGKRTIQRHINVLRDNNIIERMGGNKSGTWTIS